MTDTPAFPTSRRVILQALGASALLWGCDSGSSSDDSGGGDGTDGSSGSTSGQGATGDPSTSGGTGTSAGSTSTDPSAGSTSDGGSSSGGEESSGSSSGGQAECTDATAWATGGTAAMTMQHCYPDPFEGKVAQCMLACQTTEGPCTTEETIDRQDVTDGLVGLPVRLSLKFVDVDGCTPVEGAWVEIWHTQRLGIYSGVTPGGDFCNGGDAEAPTQMYMRGAQTTDADGVVNFDTCYPGWYSGRAIHIHFRVVVNGTDSVVSQLYFDDTLNTEICTKHPEYAKRGAPNTTNASDGIYGGPEYVLEVQRMADGAMLASKVLGLRSSPNDPSCQA